MMMIRIRCENHSHSHSHTINMFSSSSSSFQGKKNNAHVPQFFLCVLSKRQNNEVILSSRKCEPLHWSKQMTNPWRWREKSSRSDWRHTRTHTHMHVGARSIVIYEYIILAVDFQSVLVIDLIAVYAFGYFQISYTPTAPKTPFDFNSI